MTERYVPIEWNAMVDLLRMVTAADGQERSETDVQLWLGVAGVQRWRHREAIAAVVQLATEWGRSEGRRARILPGTVNEVIRNDRRQPGAWAEQQAALPPRDDSTAAGRRAAMAAYVQTQVARMSVDAAVYEPGETVEAALAARARAGHRRIDWSAIAACGGCDERGIRRDAPDVVCTHPAQDRHGDVVPSGAHTHHDDDPQKETDHAEQ
jgi:hypothetical protein